MIRPVLSFALFLSLGSCSFSDEFGTDTVALADEEGFAVLFPQSDSDEAPTQLTAGDEAWVYGKQGSRNAILRVPFRLPSPQAQLGVGIRLTKPPRTNVGSTVQGPVITIDYRKSGDAERGTLAGFGELIEVALNKSVAWNELEIVCVGSRCHLTVNGHHVHDATMRGGVGDLVGIARQQIDRGVEYGNVCVKLLPNDAVAYRVLFDGSRLDGWKLLTRTGGFLLNREDVSLTTKGRGLGLLWYPRLFRDFILMLDWKVTRKSDNSGVYVRFPDPSEDPWVVAREGYEIQIDDSGRPKRRTGSVFGEQDAGSVPTKPVGQWNHLEVRVRGQDYTVFINGQQVTEFTGDRNTTGYVGLQNHNSRARVSFRNIRVVELGD